MMPSKKSETKPRPNAHASLPKICYRFNAIGTTWKIDIYENLTRKQSDTLKAAIDARIEVFDKNYSRFRPDSLVTHMSKNSGTYHLPDDAQPLIDLYQKLYGITDGLITPLIGNTLSDAGYDAAYSLRPTKLSTPPTWDEAIDYNFPRMKIKKPVILDFGAAGKGYLVDIIGALIKTHGIRTYSINAGGDILYQTDSKNFIDIGLEHPNKPQLAIGIATIKNQSICGSAGNRRSWDKYYHIINPKRLESPRHILALWVVAETALLSDALSTALFFIPAEKLAYYYRFEYAVVRDDFSLEKSKRFPAVFFSN